MHRDYEANLSAGLGLEKVCERHDVVFFDFPGVEAPFMPGGRPNDTYLSFFTRALSNQPKCMIPQAVAEKIKGVHYGQTSARLLGILTYRIDRLGRKVQKTLRERSAVLANEGNTVTESDRMAVFHALAHARDGKSAGFVTNLDRNAGLFYELRNEFSILANKAVAYRLNLAGLYAPVDSAIGLKDGK